MSTKLTSVHNTVLVQAACSMPQGGHFSVHMQVYIPSFYPLYRIVLNSRPGVYFLLGGFGPGVNTRPAINRDRR